MSLLKWIKDGKQIFPSSSTHSQSPYLKFTNSFWRPIRPNLIPPKMVFITQQSSTCAFTYTQRKAGRHTHVHVGAIVQEVAHPYQSQTAQFICCPDSKPLSVMTRASHHRLSHAPTSTAKTYNLSLHTEGNRVQGQSIICHRKIPPSATKLGSNWTVAHCLWSNAFFW